MNGKLVRVGSHRAGEKLERLLGGKLDYHFTWADGGVFALVPNDRVAEARAITGITLARPKGEVHRCHKW